MSAVHYKEIYDWFTARPTAKRILLLSAKALPLLSIVLYPLLLLLLGLRWGAAPSDAAAFEELARAVLIPAAVFLGGTILRHCLNMPRPYEQPGFVPLADKATRGHALPSRHSVSAAVIAAAWLRTSLAVGVVLTAAALLVAVTRVLIGVHSVKDVVCGLAFGFALGLWGMFC